MANKKKSLSSPWQSLICTVFTVGILTLYKRFFHEIQQVLESISKLLEDAKPIDLYFQD